MFQIHEPDPVLRSRYQLSFEGFARYLMDGDNSAVQDDPGEEDLDQPLSRLIILILYVRARVATSIGFRVFCQFHNTFKGGMSRAPFITCLNSRDSLAVNIRIIKWFIIAQH